VVLPKLNLRSSRVYVQGIIKDRDAEWRAALATAGVAVKEVE
jgi:hypothetical protein